MPSSPRYAVASHRAIGARPRLRRRSIPGAVHRLSQQVTGVDIDPTTSWTQGDALLDRLGRPAVRRCRGESTISQSVGRCDLTRRPVEVRWRAVCRRGGRVPVVGGPFDEAGRSRRARCCRCRCCRRATLLRSVPMSSTSAALRWMWWSTTQMFDASVRVWAGVWEVGGASGEVRRAHGPQFEPRSAIAMPSEWTGLIADTAEPSHDGPTLGDIAAFTVDFRDQYYGLVGAVSDRPSAHR